MARASGLDMAIPLPLVMCIEKTDQYQHKHLLVFGDITIHDVFFLFFLTVTDIVY